MGRPKRKATEGKVYASTEVESEVDAEAPEVVTNKRQKKGKGKGKAVEAVEAEATEEEDDATEVVVKKKQKKGGGKGKGKGKGKSVVASEAEATDDEAEASAPVASERKKKGGGKGKGKSAAESEWESEDTEVVVDKRQKKGDKEQTAGKGKGKAATKKTARPNAGHIYPTASLGSSLVADLLMLGDISFMSFDTLAMLSKSSRDWNIRVGTIWKAKVEEGWEESMKGWLVKCGVPSAIISSWRFSNFVKNHLEHLRIDGIVSGVTKKCRMCDRACTDPISGLGFAVHTGCVKKLTKDGRAERTSRLQKSVSQELGIASTWKKGTVGASVHARMKSIPSAGCGTAWGNETVASIISGCNQYIDVELTFQGIKESTEYAAAMEEFQNKKAKSETRKKTTTDKRDKCQEDRRTALVKWLASQKLKHYVEFCGVQATEEEAVSDNEGSDENKEEAGGGSASAVAKPAVAVRRVHEPFTEVTKDYLAHTVASKTSFEKVKMAVQAVRDKDNAQLARQKELSTWLASTPMLQHLSTLVSYPQIVYHGAGGEECSVPRQKEKFRQSKWVTPDQEAMTDAIGTFLDYEITVGQTFEEVQAAVLEVERKNASQFNRQKVLQDWLEAKVAEVPGLASTQVLIRWPQKKSEVIETDDGEDELYVPQYKSVYIRPPDDNTGYNYYHRSVPTFTYPTGANELPVHKSVQAVVDRFVKYTEDPEVMLEDIGAQILEVQRCDAAQLQRMKDLIVWLEGNSDIVRNYIKCIRWPQTLMEQDAVKEKGWYAPSPPRNQWEEDLGAWLRPKPEDLGQLQGAVTTYLAHRETSEVSLDDIIAGITEVEASDRKQLERQESLQAWIKGRDDLKRDWLKNIRWPWVHPTPPRTATADGDTAAPETESKWEQNNRYISENYIDAEQLKNLVTEYLAYDAPDTVSLESVTEAIVAVNVVDRAQFDRNVALQTWFDEEAKRNHMLNYRFRNIRWPWAKNYASVYNYAGPTRYPNVIYGDQVFGDFLSHDLEVTMTLDAVKSRVTGRPIESFAPAVPSEPQPETVGGSQAEGGGADEGEAAEDVAMPDVQEEEVEMVM